MGGAFTYWYDPDRSALSDVVEHWTDRGGGLDVVGDAEVTDILSRLAPDFLEAYRLITIPAARSDLARLLLLYERGGLYVDSHCGVVDAVLTRRLLRDTQSDSIIAVDQSRQQRPRPSTHPILINAMLAGGRDSPHVLAIARRVIGNLEAHRARERTDGFRPYDLLTVTGPESINALTFEGHGDEIKPIAELAGRLTIWPEEVFPVQRHRFRLRPEGGTHWSERQTREVLFSNSTD